MFKVLKHVYDFLFHPVFGFKLFNFAQLFVQATSTIAPPRTEQTLAKIMVWGQKYKSQVQVSCHVFHFWNGGV